MSLYRFPIVQFISRPGIVDLAWGHPDSALLPVHPIGDATARVLARYGADALTYGANRGAGPLLGWLADRIERLEGRRPNPDEIMITGGASWGLDQLCARWTRPGDLALVESPTYYLAAQIMRDHGLDLAPIPIDEGGLRIDALATTIAEQRRAGRHPRLLYTIPTFHNPTGVCLSADRRRALIELAAAEDLLIVEDDVYRELAYDGPPPPSLWSLAPPGTVARLGSFSKSSAPGLRLGWLTAGAKVLARIAGSGWLESGGGANHFTAMVAAEFCIGGGFEAQVERLRHAYCTRRDVLAQALRQHLPAGCSWSAPAGGFFVWVTLPEGLDASALLLPAEAAGVSYLPGALCYLESGGAHALRLSFTLYSPERLAEGARRLGEAIRG